MIGEKLSEAFDELRSRASDHQKVVMSRLFLASVLESLTRELSKKGIESSIVIRRIAKAQNIYDELNKLEGMIK